MHRFFFYVGRIIPWVLFSLAALGGVGFVVNALHLKTPEVHFARIDAAKGLAIRAAKVAVSVPSNETQDARAHRYQEFGWTIKNTDFKATGTTVEILDAQPLDPEVMSPNQVLVPVKIWELVKSEKSTVQQIQIANVLILEDNGRLSVAGPPWILPDESTSTPSTSTQNAADIQPVQPLIDSFMKAWWSGGDIKNDIATGCVVPKLAFKSTSVSTESISGTKSGTDKIQAVVNLSPIDPATGVPVPMQIVLVLGQSVPDHWLIEQIYPF